MTSRRAQSSSESEATACGPQKDATGRAASTSRRIRNQSFEPRPHLDRAGDVEELEASLQDHILRAVKQRLHQASFREAIIGAYNGRCALSGIPEPLLLDAAHIVTDKDERLGQPVIPNGIPLSKIHQRRPAPLNAA